MAIDLQVEFLEKSLPQDNFSFHLWIWGKHLSHLFDAGTNYGAGKFVNSFLTKNEILHPLKLIWKLCLQMSFWLSRWQMFFDQVVPPSKDPICAVLKYQSAGRMRSLLFRPVHSPKAMTREAIWQKPKNSPENITLWLEWTSREWPRGGSFLVVETKQSIFWKTMQLLAIDDQAQLKQSCFKRKRVTAPKS